MLFANATFEAQFNTLRSEQSDLYAQLAAADEVDKPGIKTLIAAKKAEIVQLNRDNRAALV